VCVGSSAKKSEPEKANRIDRGARCSSLKKGGDILGLMHVWIKWTAALGVHLLPSHWRENCRDAKQGKALNQSSRRWEGECKKGGKLAKCRPSNEERGAETCQITSDSIHRKG